VTLVVESGVNLVGEGGRDARRWGRGLLSGGSGGRGRTTVATGAGGVGARITAGGIGAGASRAEGGMHGGTAGARSAIIAQESARSVVVCSGVGQDPAGAAANCSSVGRGTVCVGPQR
jgi:hypothetical protein